MLHLFSSASEMKSGGCGGPNGMGFLPGLAFVLLGQRNTNESDRAWWQWLRGLCCTRSHSLKRRGGDFLAPRHLSVLQNPWKLCATVHGLDFLYSAAQCETIRVGQGSLPVRCSGSGAFKSRQSRKQTIIPAMRAAPRPLKLEFEVAEAQRIRPSFAAIASLAVAKKLASIGAKEYAQAGGLIGYGVDLLGLYRRTAYFIDKILKDAKPADLPIEQPTQFELLINLNTAKTLGLQIAPAMLARAAEIIE
jgi:ABC transporter substrate binding protein